MEKIVFVSFVESDKFDFNIALLASSLRKFGGTLAESPLTVFYHHGKESITQNLKHFLSALNVKTIPLKISKTTETFPFLNFVHAAATAENTYSKKYENIVWLDSNTLILKEPKEFLLFHDKIIGYRPVHHTLIGSIIGEPLDTFWSLLYEEFKINEKNVFPMKTHVDQNILRPYFNAGCMVIRSSKGIFQNWYDKFSRLIINTAFKPFFEKDWKYKIFMHQAVLSCTILSLNDPNDLYQLPFTYNYPLHLYEETSEDYRPTSINDLVTARFENIDNPTWLDTIPLNEKHKKWLASQFDIYSKLSR